MTFETEIYKKTQILTSLASDCWNQQLKSYPKKVHKTMHKKTLLCRIRGHQKKFLVKNKKKWGNVGGNGEKSLPLHIEEFFI